MSEEYTSNGSLWAAMAHSGLVSSFSLCAVHIGNKGLTRAARRRKLGHTFLVFLEATLNQSKIDKGWVIDFGLCQ